LRALPRYSLLIIFLITGHLVWSDPLYDASLFEREGNVSEAVRLYDQWLSENRVDSGFSDILFHCASIISSVDKSLEFLFKYENDVKDQNKQDYYLRIAQIYELIFQNKNASLYYEKASVNQEGNFNYEIYLKHLQLNYQMGEIPELSVLNDILLSNISSSVYVDALIFKTEILKYSGDLNRAESILQQSEHKGSFPEIQLALWEIYYLQNNYSAISSVLNYVKKQFPDSIELSIMEGEIRKLPRLSEFFIRKEEISDKTYIQVGSFSNSENVRHQSESLKAAGFDFFYIAKENITKIIVVDSISYDQLLSLLKLKGFNGFRINYP
jgi:SPOR domain